MPDVFDPYHRWLGIPPEEQPAHHYRLLGVALFEDDPEVIENAADRQMAHLRTFQSGKNSSLSQKLLNEVAAAKICLLNADRKAVYDKMLSQQLQQRLEVVPPPLPVAATLGDVVRPAGGPPPIRKVAQRNRGPGPVVIWGAVAVGLVLAVGLVAALTRDTEEPFAVLAVDWPEGRRYGGTLTLNGKQVEVPPVGPVELPCSPGEVQVEALAPGYRPIKQTVELTAGKRVLLRPEWKEQARVSAAKEEPFDEEFWEGVFDPDASELADSPPPQSALSPQPPALLTETGPSRPPELPPVQPDPIADPVRSKEGSSDGPASFGQAKPPAASGLSSASGEPAGKPATPMPEIETDPQLDALLAEAWRSIQMGQITDGCNKLCEAAKTNRKDIRADFSLGLVAALVAHDWPAAEKHFANCTKQNPNHIASLNNLALCLMRQHEDRPALRHWEAATQPGVVPPEIAQNLGRYQFLVKSGRIKLRSSFERSLESLFQLASAGGNGFDSTVGFRFMRLAVDPAIGWPSDSAYHDRWCSGCQGVGSLKCPVRECSRGKIRTTQQKIVGKNPTGQVVFRNVPVYVPCTGCQGRGFVDCPQCDQGKERGVR